MQDPEFFDSHELYKEIAKELLFNGAERSLQTKEGLTALELLDDFKETEEDNGIEYDDYMEGKYHKFRGILIGGADCECM